MSVIVKPPRVQYTEVSEIDQLKRRVDQLELENRDLFKAVVRLQLRRP